MIMIRPRRAVGLPVWMLTLLTVIGAGAMRRAAAQTPGAVTTRADREAVRRAVLDYVEGFYEGDSVKLARSVRPEIYKYGFWRPRDSTSYAGERMTYPEFFAYAARVRTNNRQAPPTARKEVEIYDVLDHTASAKLTAFWGTDYLLLGRYDGRWMISSVLWQSFPPARPSGASAPSGDRGRAAADGSGNDNAVEAFAPDVLALDSVYRGVPTPDGNAFYFFRKVARQPGDEDYRIYEVRRVHERWTAPVRVDLGGEYSDLYPSISPDGRRLVFASYRPVPGDTSSHRNAHLWYADRTPAGWGPPVFMAKASLLGYYNAGPQFLDDGSVYWQATAPDWRSQASYISRWNGREYSAPERFEPAERLRRWRDDMYVWNVRLAPDRSFALLEVSALDAARRRAPADLYLAVRRGDDWSEPRPLTGGVNTGATEHFSIVSPDGRYLYFVRDYSGFYRAELARVIPSAGR